MKSRLSKSEQNRADAASLLFELEEEAELQSTASYASSKNVKADNGSHADRPEVSGLSASENQVADPSVNTARTGHKEQTGNKVATNKEQTRNTANDKRPINQEQTGNKGEAKWKQESGSKFETGNKVGSQLGTGVGTNQQQSANKLGTNRDVSTLRGLQKRILVFLYHSCLKARAQTTERLAIQKIALACETSVQSGKVTIRRLEKMGFIFRSSFENGRGGWTVYSLPDAVHSYLRLDETENKVGTNWEQSGSKVGSQLGTQLGTSPPSSSREVFFKESSTTPTTVTDELGSLNLTELREFGITIETFKRAVQLHPAVTIEALSDLAFRLSELFKNPKERAKIQNARGFVIKLVEQLSHGITPLDHIETNNDRLMREYAQAAKQKRVEQQGFEETLLQEAFAKWDQELGEDEKFRQVPLAQSAPAGTPRAAIFREHFRENVWPETRERILRGEA